MPAELLASWNDGPARRAVTDFVARVATTGSADYLPPDLHQGQHPTLRAPFVACGYQPMVELLRYLEAHDFATFIASGGDRDSCAW